MQVHDIQVRKTDKRNWCNENIYETQFQFMYAVMFKYPKKSKCQRRHSYEQDFGYVWGLPK